jgi:hypothetical protein
MKLGDYGYQRKWAKENPEKVKEYQRRYLEKRKERILEFYGSKCEKCGFDDPRVLKIDTREKTIKKIFEGIQWGEKSSQLLCANCWVLEGQKEVRMKGTGRLVEPLPIPD